MKKLTSFFLKAGLILSLGVVAASCTDDKTKNPTPNGPDPDGNTYYQTSVATPIRYAASPFIGKSEGVSVEVTSATSDQLKFVLKPGADINSYRVQAYPMASIYNSLLNQMNKEEATALTVDETAAFLQAVVQDEASTAPGVLISKKVEGDDFASKEIDYMNSALQAFIIQPNTDYLIVVQAYFDTEGKPANAGDFCIVHAKTPAREIVGDPKIEMIISKGWTSYRVDHVPNDDCVFFYYLSTPTSEIQQYIDVYGDEMYRTLLCNYGSRVTATETDALAFSATQVDPKIEHTATAIALDVNGTAVGKIARQDFTLPIIPEQTEDPECTIDQPHKIGAAVFRFNVHLSKTCKNMYYAVYTKAEAQKFINGDAITKEAEAMRLSLYGWGVHNKNFSFDTENGVSTGESFQSDEKWDDDILKAGGEYVIGYIGENYYGKLSVLEFTDPFTLKPRNKSAASTSQTDVNIVFEEGTRTSLSWTVTYTTEKTAVFYWQDYRQETGEGAYKFPDEESDEEPYRGQWLHYLIDFRDGPMNSRWANMDVPIGSGTDNYVERVDGYQPSTPYRFAYAGEDWNGVVGPVKFFNGSTLTPVGGPNPLVSISGQKDTGNDYTIQISANEDTREIWYLCFSVNDLQAKDLALVELKKKDPSLSYEDYVEAWEKYLSPSIGGLMTQELSASMNVTMNGDLMAAMALAVGGDAGKPIYSKIATLIVANGKMQSLEDYLGVKTVTQQVIVPLAGPWRATKVAPKNRPLRAWEIKNM